LRLLGAAHRTAVLSRDSPYRFGLACRDDDRRDSVQTLVELARRREPAK
jgi:hypothetical protein